ncbi:MAG: TonB-dependent receptor, partial [Flavobacterium sp.]|nr:TonB-dependent receptor [Flavobacterium sp.]
MNAKFIKWCVCAVFLTSISYAQETDSLQITRLKEVVVSDTKFQQEKEKSGKIIEVISAKDLENKKGQSLATILSQVVGIEINGNHSANGKNQGIYIRGGRNRQVAIYIDGVPMNDASNINSEYDLRLLNVSQIEKIEILKGSSSTLYGSGAATGVINITLKKASQKEITGSAFLNIGTQNDASKKDIDANDFSQGFLVNGTIGKVSYLTSLNSSETRGFSEAAGENFETDIFSRVNVMQKVGFKVNDKLSLDFFGNYDKLKTTFDNSFAGFAAFADDLNNASTSEQFRIGFTPKYKYNKGEFIINTAASEINRVLQLSNSFSGTVDRYDYASRSVNVDAFNKYTFSKELYLVLGTQFQYFDMKQQDEYTDVVREKAKFSLVDPYATLVYNSNFGFNINTGARYNNHSEYGSKLVYNINPSYTFEKLPLRIVSSYSTAYITPSLYQLYGPYGNLALTPEENITTEAGFEI